MCRIERFEKEISVAEYLEGYVAVEEFLECCRACPNYEKVWSCPPYDFDVMEYWNRGTTLRVLARKIYLDGVSGQAEAAALLESVKEDMSRELYQLEEANPGSVSLSAGSCSLCREAFGGMVDGAEEWGAPAESGQGRGCTRLSGQPCRYPEKMRYSIESLGGNVGLTCRKLMGIQLEWIEEGKLPSFFVLCAGLLLP